MSEWLESLTEIQRIFAYIALPSTVVLLFQTVLLFFGISGGSSDNVSDECVTSDSEGTDIKDVNEIRKETEKVKLNIFSVHGIVAMLCIGCWAGIVLIDFSVPPVLSIVLAVLVGAGALVGIAFLRRTLKRINISENIVFDSAVGKSGIVSLKIPGDMAGTGKINITIRDIGTEFEAVTSDPSDIDEEETVYVESVDEEERLIVSRTEKEQEND